MLPIADYHIYEGRAKEAFERHGCPACGEEVSEHVPGDAEDYEYVRFGCGCELLVMEDGALDIERQCENATRAAIEARVVYHDAPLAEQESDT